jgi:hypothetical protein
MMTAKTLKKVQTVCGVTAIVTTGSVAVTLWAYGALRTGMASMVYTMGGLADIPTAKLMWRLMREKSFETGNQFDQTGRRDD